MILNILFNKKKADLPLDIETFRIKNVLTGFYLTIDTEKKFTLTNKEDDKNCLFYCKQQYE